MCRIYVLPNLTGRVGGPASFQGNLVTGMSEIGVDVVAGCGNAKPDAVLVINGCRDIHRLIRWRREGVPIVQRLGGLNWQHRSLTVSPRGFLLAEFRNLTMMLIRRYIADRVVYQSSFVEEWWNRSHGMARVPTYVIYNGADLQTFQPSGIRYESKSDVCIITVEGHQGSDFSDSAIGIARSLEKMGLSVELLVLGTLVKGSAERFACHPSTRLLGRVPHEELPCYLRGSSVFVATDVIAACPNSVIEALACGVPVIGYAEGALPELVSHSVGGCVPYLGNPWRGESPRDYNGLASAALRVLGDAETYRANAREMAQQRYGLENMVGLYRSVLFAQ